MEIFGVGMSELVFIVIIALIVLGPKDMQKAGKTIGKWMRDIVTSDGWKVFQQTSRELRTLPNKLMRDANEELNKIGNEVNASDPAQKRPGSFDSPPRSKSVPPAAPVPASPATEKKDDATPPVEAESPKDTPETNA
jgi:sec-independent protein translocase protein TatB